MLTQIPLTSSPWNLTVCKCFSRLPCNPSTRARPAMLFSANTANDSNSLPKRDNRPKNPPLNAEGPTKPQSG